MTIDKLFTDDEPLRFKIIKPVYETLTVNDAAVEYFEPLVAITSSAHVTRLFDFLGRKPESTSGRATSTARIGCSAWTPSRPVA